MACRRTDGKPLYFRTKAGQDLWRHMPSSDYNELTHLPLDKMAAISQTIFPDGIFVNETFCILFKISTKFVPKGRINDNAALV